MLFRWLITSLSNLSLSSSVVLVTQKNMLGENKSALISTRSSKFLLLQGMKHHKLAYAV